MDEESKTADGRRRWQRWTEREAQAALDELAQSGVSAAKFAESKGVSTQRLWYWRKRLAEAGPTQFVAVDLTSARAAMPIAPSRIEIVASCGMTVRVREDLDVEHLARIVDALARRPRGC
jgi:hypothetical protein